jgi:hypothetical protein
VQLLKSRRWLIRLCESAEFRVLIVVAEKGDAYRSAGPAGLVVRRTPSPLGDMLGEIGLDF